MSTFGLSFIGRFILFRSVLNFIGGFTVLTREEKKDRDVKETCFRCTFSVSVILCEDLLVV